MPSEAQFRDDHQGKRFVGVLNDRRYNFRNILAFFDDPTHRQRMQDAQFRGQPALSGVIGGLEALPDVDAFFRSTDAHETTRFRQAIGVVVRMVMEELGWSRTGQKGYLGQRVKVPAGTTNPGDYYNASGPSRWFNRAEHYRPPAPRAGRQVDRTESQAEYAERVRRGLDALAEIGTEEERQETLDYLMAALAATRREEGRPF